MDIQLVTQQIEHAKELVGSVLEAVRARRS
jgi:hypothetical protein